MGKPKWTDEQKIFTFGLGGYEAKGEKRQILKDAIRTFINHLEIEGIEVSIKDAVLNK